MVEDIKAAIIKDTRGDEVDICQESVGDINSKNSEDCTSVSHQFKVIIKLMNPGSFVRELLKGDHGFSH